MGVVSGEAFLGPAGAPAGAPGAAALTPAERAAALRALALDRQKRAAKESGICAKMMKYVSGPIAAALGFALLGVTMGMLIAIYIKLKQAGLFEKPGGAGPV